MNRSLSVKHLDSQHFNAQWKVSFWMKILKQVSVTDTIVSLNNNIEFPFNTRRLWVEFSIQLQCLSSRARSNSPLAIRKITGNLNIVRAQCLKHRRLTFHSLWVQLEDDISC